MHLHPYLSPCQFAFKCGEPYRYRGLFVILQVHFGWRPVRRVKVPWLYCICVFLWMVGRVYLPFWCDFLWFIFVSVTLGFWCYHRGVVCTVPVWIYISHRCWLGLGATTDIHDQQRRKPKIPPILENISPQTTSKMSIDSYKACKRSQLMHPNIRNGTRSGIWTRGSTQLNPPQQCIVYYVWHHSHGTMTYDKIVDKNI